MQAMAGQKKSRLRNALEQLLLVGAVVVIFYFIFRRVKIQDVLLALKNVDPARFFIISFIFVATTFLVDVSTHFVLFKQFKFGFGFWEMLKLRLANLLFTGLGFLYGQGGMAWMASRDSKRPAGQVVGLLVLLFFCSFHAALFWVTLGLSVLLPSLKAEGNFKWLWLWAAVSWPGLILWIWFWQSRFKSRVPAWLRENPFFGFDHARPLQYLELIGLRALQFLVIAVCVWGAMPALDVHVPFRAVLSILPLQGIIIGIPTPGRYGVNEGAYLLLFRNWAEESRLVAFGLLWGTSGNVIRSLASLAATRKLRGK